MVLDRSLFVSVNVAASGPQGGSMHRRLFNEP